MDIFRLTPIKQTVFFDDLSCLMTDECHILVLQGDGKNLVVSERIAAGLAVHVSHVSRTFWGPTVIVPNHNGEADAQLQIGWGIHWFQLGCRYIGRVVLQYIISNEQLPVLYKIYNCWAEFIPPYIN